MSERFFAPLTVRFYEVDLQGHVFFANYLKYFDVAVTEYQKALGHSYTWMSEQGVDMVYVDARAQYQGSARFDDELRVYCEVEHLGNTSLRFGFEVVRPADGRTLVTGSITGVTLDQQTRKPVPLPEPFRRSVLEHQDTPGGAPGNGAPPRRLLNPSS